VASPRGPFDHTLHVDSAGLACADCHEVRKGEAARLKTETCATCHT
jgi:hypothetical protein